MVVSQLEKKNIKNDVYTPTIRFMPCNLPGARIEIKITIYMYICSVQVFFVQKYVEETESVDWDNIEENFFRSKLSQEHHISTVYLNLNFMQMSLHLNS